MGILGARPVAPAHRVRPGVIFALYLVLGGLERFLVEFIRRNADSFAGLTAAQLWSVAMMRRRARVDRRGRAARRAGRPGVGPAMA